MSARNNKLDPLPERIVIEWMILLPMKGVLALFPTLSHAAYERVICNPLPRLLFG